MKKIRRFCRAIVRLLLFSLLVSCVVAALLTGCRPAREVVEVPSVRVEKEYVDRWRRDSVVVGDSVMVMIKGDTVWRDRWRMVYRDRWRTDSVLVRDSVLVTEVVEVPARLTGWQQWKMRVGGWALVAVVTLMGVGVFRFFRG